MRQYSFSSPLSAPYSAAHLTVQNIGLRLGHSALRLPQFIQTGLFLPCTMQPILKYFYYEVKLKIIYWFEFDLLVILRCSVPTITVSIATEKM